MLAAVQKYTITETITCRPLTFQKNHTIFMKRKKTIKTKINKKCIYITFFSCSHQKLLVRFISCKLFYTVPITYMYNKCYCLVGICVDWYVLLRLVLVSKIVKVLLYIRYRFNFLVIRLVNFLSLTSMCWKFSV